MTSLVYDSFLEDISSGNIDLSADTVYAMLVTSSYAPNQQTDNRRDDVTNEVVGTGYTAGGQAATLTGVLDTATDKMKWTLTDVVWAASSITARAAVLYKHRGGASSADELICYVDFGSDQTSSAGTFTFHGTSPLAFAA
jgi:hypothetical protein